MILVRKLGHFTVMSAGGRRGPDVRAIHQQGRSLSVKETFAARARLAPRRGSTFRTGTPALKRYTRYELEYQNNIIQSEGKAHNSPNKRFSLFVHNLFLAHFESLVGAGARCAVLLTARCVHCTYRLKQTFSVFPR